MDEEVRSSTDDNGSEAFNDKSEEESETKKGELAKDLHPPPTSIATNTVHVCYAPRQNTAKCSGKRSCREEERNSILSLISFVIHGQIVHDSCAN